MAIKTIFVGASGGTACTGAVDLASRLASRFNAHLEGFHARLDPYQIILSAAGDGAAMPVDPIWIDQLTEDAAKLAATTKDDFFRTADTHGLGSSDQPTHDGAGAAWRDQIGRATELVPARARFFDLVVLGRSDRIIDQPSTDVIEQTLLDAGRPVLLAPEKPPATIGEKIAIAWDGSPRSVRAVTAAMPFLRRAKRVVVLTIGDEPEADASALADYLKWHRIASDRQDAPAASGVPVGEQLLAIARDCGADLLAMGAFGHAPWREMLFGGATRTVVGISLLPVLMTH